MMTARKARQGKDGVRSPRPYLLHRPDADGLVVKVSLGIDFNFNF